MKAVMRGNLNANATHLKKRLEPYNKLMKDLKIQETKFKSTKDEESQKERHLDNGIGKKALHEANVL